MRLLNQLRLQPISELSLAYYVPTLTYGAIHQLWGKCVLLARLTAAPLFFSYLPSIEYFIIELDFFDKFSYSLI